MILLVSMIWGASDDSMVFLEGPGSLAETPRRSGEVRGRFGTQINATRVAIVLNLTFSFLVSSQRLPLGLSCDSRASLEGPGSPGEPLERILGSMARGNAWGPRSYWRRS